MKKLSIILVLFAFAISSFAQIYEGKKALGQPSDTINKDGVKSYDWDMFGDKPYNFSLLVKVDSIAGYPKSTSVLEYSIGGYDWFPLMKNDTTQYSVTNVAGNDTSFVFSNINQFMGNHLRVKTTAIDSIQTVKVTYYFKNWYINKF